MGREPRNRLLFGAAAVLAAAAFFWLGALRRDVFPRNFGVVEPGVLYRSAALTPAALRRVVEEHHIRTIVDLGAYDKDPAGDRLALRTAEALGLKRFTGEPFRLEGDGTGYPDRYAAALRVINDPANHPVLVHCATGAQRTGVCVLLYRDLVQGRPWNGEAFDEARSHRHNPRDNPRFSEYLRTHRDEIAEKFRARSEAPTR